jgi:hypothetical protein
LWTATTGGISLSTPAIANGVVYVGAADGLLYAFDSTGTAGCSGTPKTCTPLWTATTGATIDSSPVVAGGLVYVGSYDDNLYAFDASGTTGCAGTPKTCAPVWTGPTDAPVSSSPAVAHGVIYVGSDEDHSLFAFDSKGSAGCSGTPKFCEPLWRASTTLHIGSSPAVANGTVYIGAHGLNTVGTNVLAYDAKGTTNCSGTPTSCTPLWSTGVANFLVYASPAVANGVVYNSSADGHVYAYDATSGAPLWNAAVGDLLFQSPIVANGILYATSFTGLFAFKP